MVIIRVFGAILAEQADEWAERRRRLGLDILSRYRISFVPTTEPEIGADTARRLTASPPGSRSAVAAPLPRT